MTTSLVSVAVSVTKIHENTPDLGKQAVLSAILSGEDLVTSIQGSYRKGFPAKVLKCYRYAERQRFVGLPVSNKSSIPYEGVEIVQPIVEAEVGEAITVVSLVTSHPDPAKLGGIYWEELLDIPEDAELQYEEVKENLLIYHFYYPIKGGEDVSKIPFSRDYAVESMQTSSTHLYMGYTKAGDTTIHYWVYDPVWATYPEIVIPPGNEFATLYYPVTTLIKYGYSVGRENIHSVKMLKYLDIDMAEMMDVIEANEDIDKISSAFLLFSVDANASDDISLRYLYALFRVLKYTSKVTHAEFAAWAYDKVGYTPLNKITITDGLMNATIQYNYITIRTVVGSVDSPQPSNYTTSTEGNSEIDADNRGKGKVIRLVIPGTSYEGYSTTLLVLLKQLTDTTYVELVISGLRHSTYIWRNAYAIRDIGGESDGGFYLPISKDIVELFNGRDRSAIHIEALKLVIYAKEEQELKWYQEASFLSIVQNVIIILAIVFNAEAVGEAVSAGIAAVLELVATSIVMGAIYSAGITALAKKVGGAWAAVIMLVGKYVASKYGYGTDFSELPWAEQLLEITKAVSSVVVAYTADEYDELIKEAALFNSEAQDRKDEIDAARELLGGVVSSVLPYTIGKSTNDFYESPQDFYSRTIHSGNIGVLSLNAIENFVSNKLTLPRATGDV